MKTGFDSQRPDMQIFTLGVLLILFGLNSPAIFAQNKDSHTIREEAEGKAIWERLQAKEKTCAELSDDDFGALGEYFMGQMSGTSHEAMNITMEQMMGKEGEEQMHVVMGKRLSGCDTSAAIPSQGVGFIPMMQMMMGGLPVGQAGWSPPLVTNKEGNFMMWNYGTGPIGWMGLGFGWLFMLFLWLIIIAGIIFLIRWMITQITGGPDWGRKSALDILKERYARGEIDKKEFEEKKKDLT